MFEFAKNQLHTIKSTTITPTLTSLNATITTLRPHATGATASKHATNTCTVDHTRGDSGSGSGYSMSVSHPAGAGTGLPATPNLTLLSDIHPLIPLGAKNKKSTDATAVAMLTSSEIVDLMDTSTVTTPDFNHVYFESSLFKITLSDSAHDSLDIHGGKLQPQSQLQTKDDLKATIESGPYADGGGSVFYIHKALLASLSPELRKHTDNQMREGLRGEMLLGEVDRQTMQRFLQWAYRGEYTVYVWSLIHRTKLILMPMYPMMVMMMMMMLTSNLYPAVCAQQDHSSKLPPNHRPAGTHQTLRL